jgi:hypothetical protein
MIGIGDLRQWVGVLWDAFRARVPHDLVGPGTEPDDKRLDGYLLRAALLSAGARWTRGHMLPAIEAGYRAQGADPLADATREALDVRAAASAIPVPGLGALLDMGFTLAAFAAAIALMIRLSGRRPVPWRIVAASTLAVYLVFSLWGLVAGWIALKLGAFRLPSPETMTLVEFAGRALAALFAIAVLVMPAVALGRAARVIAPGFRYPFAAGVLAWLVGLVGSAAFTLVGAEKAIVRFLVPPAP